MDPNTELKTKIFYYFREKYYNLMLNACKDGLVKFKGDVSYNLFHSLSLILINRLEEGVHDLEAIRAENDVKLAVTIALIYGHKLLGVTNKDLFIKLDNQMREYRKQTEAIDFYYSAFVLATLNKFEKALDYIDKALNLQNGLAECQTLKGWILLKLQKRGVKSKSTLNINISEIFERAVQFQPKNLDALIGLSESFLYNNNFDEALNTINKAVVRFTTTTLPLLQKIKILFASQDYEQTIETINRVTISDANNLLAQKYFIIILLSRDADYANAVKHIKAYVKDIEELELHNVHILLESSQLFSRLANKDFDVLTETSKMLELALQFNSDNANVVVELGYQCLLMNKIKEALRYFKTATKIDDSSLNALLGLSLVELAENGNTNQLKNQVDFLLNIKDAQNSALLHFIQAKTAGTAQESLTHLQEIYKIQTARLKSVPYSDTYLSLLDPDFMLDVVHEYLKYTSGKTNLDEVFEILKLIVKSCPGLAEGLFLLAKLQCLKGDYNNATTTLESLLNKSGNTMSEAHLLMAQIQVHNNLFERAAQSLEICVSNNFRIRDNPIYHYTTAVVEKNLKNYDEAVKSLTTALSLIKTSPINLSEKASLYVELIDTLNIVGQVDEATKMLEDATVELKGTVEESRILLFSADHCLERKNIQGAIDLLDRIKPNESCYMEAKKKHAEILLKYRKDAVAFLQCYKDLVQDSTSSESYILLGDAYMTVLEPDEALKCYELALKENPRDSFLISKMGNALVETHYFARAVNFYKDQLKSVNNPELKLQLAQLYMNLKQYSKGELILIEELESEDDKSDDITHLQFRSKLLNLLAQIQDKSGNISEAKQTLKNAMDNQSRLRKRFILEQGIAPENEINAIVEIAIKLGELSINLKNNEKAINYFKEGLDVSPNNVTILVALAKLYMQMNYLELCQQTCATILRTAPENESASVMMADIAFRKVDFDMALFHFTQLITKQPTNWEALIRLIEILRRTGNIQDCPEYLHMAEQHCEIPSKEPGLFFCKGLFDWYSGNLNSALKNFNNARQDPEFGQQAIYNMIEICLNPDDEMFAEQHFMDYDDSEYRDSRSMALKTADRLLRELKQRIEANGDEILKYKLLVNFRLLATKEKYNVERALEDFVSVASQPAYRDHVGAILGVATAHTMLKQSQRAKNQLKRVVKSIWTFEDAEYLERCWLMLADYYVQSAKYDVATDLIYKVIEHNKACTKGYEYLGIISEKEQQYKEAANYYEHAWKFGGKSNPSVAFKLAYCLLKAKKFPDAIDMAQEVLKLNPDYPKVKKDILDKAMNNLRI